MIKLSEIDVDYDFTLDDNSYYWKNFWQNKNGLGVGNCDPDISSVALKRYHQSLWSKKLPNGEFLDLVLGKGNDYLTWKNFRFGSDSIVASFRYEKNRHILEDVKNSLSNYYQFMENFLHKTYTIGGAIIFLKRQGGINQSRGCNPKIKDRWDLTLECIRKYYLNEVSPLYNVLDSDRNFFELFIDFKGYINFFYLNDCVSADYKKVIFGINHIDFTTNCLPKSKEEYFQWLNFSLDFVKKRNCRIKEAIKNRNK